MQILRTFDFTLFPWKKSSPIPAMGRAIPARKKMLAGNSEPVVRIPLEGGFFIPHQYPFRRRYASDAEGDALTYSWEQYDLVQSIPDWATRKAIPLFAFSSDRKPTGIPKTGKILSNNYDITEVLPPTVRNVTFAASFGTTIRRAALRYGLSGFKVDGTAVRFRVLSPNTFADLWIVGSNTEIRWDVANTDNGVGCQKSTSNYLWTEATPILSCWRKTLIMTVRYLHYCAGFKNRQVRVRIEAADNIFFDVSSRILSSSGYRAGLCSQPGTNDISPMFAGAGGHRDTNGIHPGLRRGPLPGTDRRVAEAPPAASPKARSARRKALP